MNKSNVKTNNKTELLQVYSLCEKVGMRLDLPVDEMVGYPQPVIFWDRSNVGGNFSDGYIDTISFEEFLKKIAEYATKPDPVRGIHSRIQGQRGASWLHLC
jgi:hypothetical protein